MKLLPEQATRSPAEIALHASVWNGWERHLDEGGIAMLVEPRAARSSRASSSRSSREILLALKEKKKIDWLQILLPCHGHQACGGLGRRREDECHEDIRLVAPAARLLIDQLAGLDRKTLPFSATSWQ